MKQFVLALIILFAPNFVSAHSFGTFYQEASGPYTVDIGYSLPAPQAGESVMFEFELWDAKRETVPFSATWVRIEDERGATIYAGGLYNDPFGGPRMSIAFPKAGKYTVSARYDRDAQAIAEGSFPLTVIPAAGEASKTVGWPVYVASGVALALVVAGLLYVRRRRS